MTKKNEVSGRNDETRRIVIFVKVKKALKDIEIFKVNKDMMKKFLISGILAAAVVCCAGCASMATAGRRTNSNNERGMTDNSGRGTTGDNGRSTTANKGRGTCLDVTNSGRSSICGPNMPYSAAHRGCHLDGLIQENTPAAVAMAARYGYRAIECDVKYTADSVMVIMHDGTINRTMRNAADYSPIVEKVKVSETKFADLRSKYVIASSDESLRTQIPTLEELIAACKQYGILPILHSALPESYAYTKSVVGDDFVAFDVNYEALKKAREISSCLILWDPGERSADETIAMLKELGGRCGVSSMSNKLLDAKYIAKVRAAGFEVQSSIWPTPKELMAVNDGATIILSDFNLFRVKNVGKAVRKSVKAELGRGDRVRVEWKKTEFGSIEMALEYTGPVEVIVNGEMVYELPFGAADEAIAAGSDYEAASGSAAGSGTEPFSQAVSSGKIMKQIGGWRFHALAPSIEVRAFGPAKVKLKAAEYVY